MRTVILARAAIAAVSLAVAVFNVARAADAITQIRQFEAAPLCISAPPPECRERVSAQVRRIYSAGSSRSRETRLALDLAIHGPRVAAMLDDRGIIDHTSRVSASVSAELWHGRLVQLRGPGTAALLTKESPHAELDGAYLTTLVALGVGLPFAAFAWGSAALLGRRPPVLLALRFPVELKPSRGWPAVAFFGALLVAWGLDPFARPLNGFAFEQLILPALYLGGLVLLTAWIGRGRISLSSSGIRAPGMTDELSYSAISRIGAHFEGRQYVVDLHFERRGGPLSFDVSSLNERSRATLIAILQERSNAPLEPGAVELRAGRFPRRAAWDALTSFHLQRFGRSWSVGMIMFSVAAIGLGAFLLDLSRTGAEEDATSVVLAVGALSVVVGIVPPLLRWRQLQRERRLRVIGTPTQGEVAEIISSAFGDGGALHYTYDSLGEHHRGIVWGNWGDIGRWRIGDRGAVLYDATRPQVSMWAESAPPGAR